MVPKRLLRAVIQYIIKHLHNQQNRCLIGRIPLIHTAREIVYLLLDVGRYGSISRQEVLPVVQSVNHMFFPQTRKLDIRVTFGEILQRQNAQTDVARSSSKA